MTPSPRLAWTDLDRRIWEEELAEFVPQRVFDVHTHLYRWADNLAPDKDQSAFGQMLGPEFRTADWALAERVDALLLPGRSVQRLAFPFPFPDPVAADSANAFLAEQLQHDAASAGLLLVQPRMSGAEVGAALDRYGFVGVKPYRFYSRTGDIAACRMTDFLPEEQLAEVDRRGALVMMHVAKRDAIADEENLRDLEELTQRYPRVQWILAHCARSYSDWPLRRAGPRLARMNNLWYDVSSVCESDALTALLEAVGPQRVMYGSDDVPIGVLRGKYVAFGRAWAYLSESNHALGLAHCDGRMTFTRYEQLRAMRRAALRVGLSGAQIAALFYDTAAALVASARRASKCAPEAG